MIRSHRSLTLLAVIASAAAAAWGLWSWFDPNPWLTTRLRDDAFYEFVWAANVADGRGATVSDGVTTSGVQWLWTVLLVPFAHAAWWLAPWLGLALHVATAAIWILVPRDRVTGWCLALCWLGNPLLLREAQNGQETALAVFVATLLVVLRRRAEPWFLCLSVLAVLARSDLLGLVVMLSWSRHRERPWRALLAPAIAFAVPLLPNALCGGGLLQDSGMPMAWLWHENLEAARGFWSTQWWFTRPVLLGGPFATASAFGFGFVTFLLVRPWWPVAGRVLPALLVGVACSLGAHDLATAGWAALLLLLLPTPRTQAPDRDLLAVALGLGAIVVLHWAVRWYPRDYYLAPLVIVPFVALLRFGRWRLLLLAFAVVQLLDSWRVQPEPLAGQRAMELAGCELSEVLPAGERVGCFNSGIVTYYADVVAREVEGGKPHGIVNLDGVVDHRSFAALRERRLSAWLDQQGVRFLLDAPHQFALDPAVPHACGRFFGDGFDPDRDLVELVRFVVVDAPAAAPAMKLYWRRGRGERPAPAIRAGERRDRFGERSRSAFELWPTQFWGARAGETLVAIGPNGARERLHQVDRDVTVVLLLPDRLCQGGVQLVIDGP